MLALIYENSIVTTVAPGGGFTLPNGDRVSPANVGWELGSFRLAEVLPADEVPAGKHVVSTTVELISGQPKYVNTLEDVPPPTTDDVNVERDRRVAAGTTVVIDTYGPVPLQGREKDQTNLLGLLAAANMRIAAGDVETTTKFRDAENVDHLLTPPQIVEMWSKGSAWISAVYDASWALKEVVPIPADYTDDAYWPT